MKKEEIQLLVSYPLLVSGGWNGSGLTIMAIDIDSLIEILAPIISPSHPLEYERLGPYYEVDGFEKFLKGYIDFDIKEIFYV